MLIGERFVFVENPKTGSTSVNNALFSVSAAQRVLKKHENFSAGAERQYNRRYRVVAVRNPWDRMVSGYLFNNRGKHKQGREIPQFEEWLQGDKWQIAPGIDFKRTPQCFWTWKMNTIFRFERISEDFEEFCQTVGIKATLPHDNASKDRQPYTHYYTEKTKRIVEDRFWPDIIEYNYKFDDRSI